MFPFLKISVDSIMAAHSKTIDQLERLAVRQDETAGKIEDEIRRMVEKRDAALIESSRASGIAANLRALYQ